MQRYASKFHLQPGRALFSRAAMPRVAKPGSAPVRVGRLAILLWPALTCLLSLSTTASAQLTETGISTSTADSTLAAVAPSNTEANATRPTGRLIIKYRQTDSAPGFITKSARAFDRSRWRARLGLVVSRELSGQQELVKAYSGSHSGSQSASGTANSTAGITEELRQQITQQLGNSADVVFVSPEYVRQPMLVPNDPLYQDNSLADHSSPGNQSYLYEGAYSVQAPGAWDITTGSESQVIAIVDTGVLSSHPELAERSVPGLGYDFVSANNPGDFTNANDGDGRDADPTDPGDYCLSKPSSWHGTEVASVAAGQANDGQGMAGIDWNARILHARALGRCGGTDADIIDAVRWSAGIPVPGLPANPSPAQVINLSIGGPTECTRAWQDVIDQLNERDVSMVVAAGNEATNALRSSPANCAGVISVGASTSEGGLDTFYSNYGLKVTVAAPGSNILLATNTGITDFDEDGNTYQTESGSSLSAAIVSGAVSLLHSLNTTLTNAEVRAILQNSATPYAEPSNCSNYFCGGGILNLAKAMTTTAEASFDASFTTSGNLEREVVESQAEPLPLKQEIESSLAGYRDIRYYVIDAPEDGMLTVSSNSEADLYGYLLDSNFSVLALDDDSGGSRQFRVASRVTAGRYYLAAERMRHQLFDTETPFTLYADLGVDQPTAFTLDSIDKAPGNSTVTSNTITISGLTSSALMTISGGFYSLNESGLSSRQVQVSNGDEVSVSVKTAGAAQSTTVAHLSIGAYSTSFVVTTSDTVVKTASATETIGGCTVSTTNADFSLLFLLCMAMTAVARRRTENRGCPQPRSVANI